MSIREINKSDFFRKSKAAALPLLGMRYAGMLLAILLFSISASAQDPNDFLAYKEITIDAAQVGGTDLTDFPFLFSSTDPEFATIGNGGMLCNNSGYDILFTASDGTTLLDFQLEEYNGISGEIVAWVKTNISASTNTILRIYYGNCSIIADNSTENTWPANYSAVYHFGAGEEHTDATNNTNDLANNGTASTGSPVATGIDSDGDFLTAPLSPELSIDGDLTIEALISAEGLDETYLIQKIHRPIVSTGLPTEFEDDNILYEFGVFDHKLYFKWEYDDGLDVYLESTVTIEDSTWLSVAVVRNTVDQSVTFFVNGAPLGDKLFYTDAPTGGTNSTFQIGANNQVAVQRFKGQMDEVRISDTVLPPDRLLTSHNSTMSPSTFYSMGATMCNLSFTYPQSTYINGGGVFPVPDFISMPGGTFSASSGIMVSDNSTGEINVNGSTPGGPYYIEYSIGACVDSFEMYISSSSCDATFIYPAISVALGTPNPAPTITGDTGGTFTSSSSNLIVAPSSGEIDLSTSTAGGPYDIRYSSPDGCFTEFSVTITSCDATFSYSKTTYCETEVHPIASITGDVGGTFSSPDGIIFNNSVNGSVNLLTSPKGGPYDIVYSAPNGCTDTVQITINPVPSVSNAGLDQLNLCGVTTTTLTANSPTIGVGEWDILSGAGGSFTDPLLSNADFTGTIGVTYTLEWRISNSTCLDTYDEVTIEFGEAALASDAGIDQLGSTNCGTLTTTLGANLPAGHNGTWAIVSGGTGSFTALHGPFSDFTADASGTYRLSWELDRSGCTSIDFVDIEFSQNPTPAAAGSDDSVCGLMTYSLNGNTPVVGSGEWSIVSGGTGAFTSNSDANADFTPDALGTYVLRWTTDDGVCSPSTDDVSITFNAVPVAASIPDYAECSISTTIQSDLVASADYYWTVITGGGSISDPLSRTTAVTTLTPGTNIFEVEVTLGLCSATDRLKVLVDSISPILNLPADTDIYMTLGSCDADTMATIAQAGIATSSDDCTIISTTRADIIDTTCEGAFNIRRVWKVQDEYGHVTVDTQRIQVLDTIRPTFDPPANVIVYVHPTINSVDATPSVTGSPTNVLDNCSSTPLVTHTDSFGGTGCHGLQGSITRRWEVEDACGNISYHDQIITVSDSTLPTFTVPRDTIIWLTIAGCTYSTTIADVGDVTDEADNGSSIGEATSSDSATSPCPNEEVITRTWTLIDNCGNSNVQTQLITIRDTISPTFTVPPPTTVYLDNNCDVDITVSVTQDVTDEGDNCGTTNEATFTDVIDNGAVCGSGYTITRTWTLVDNCSNSTSQIQIITIEDTIAPKFMLPANTTVYTDGLCNYDADSSITGIPTLIDENCPEAILPITFTDVITPGTCDGTFDIVRTWTLSDVCGNRRDQDQLISVRDSTPPTFDLPADVDLYLNADCDPIAVPVALTGNVSNLDDDCTTVLNATYADSPQNPLCGNSYSIERTWTVIDNCGNRTDQIQTINILDTVPPTYTVPRDTTIFQDGSCVSDTSFVGTKNVTDELDNCSTGIEAVYQDSVVSNVCVGSYIVYRNWTLTDECGNTNAQQQIITVEDKVAPIFLTPQNDTLYVDDVCFVDTTLVGLGNIITVLDNCPAPLDTVYADVVTPRCDGSYELRRTWTLTDDCGNSTSRDQTIIILDTIAPTFTMPNDTTIYLDISCDPNITPAISGDVNDEADNCTPSLALDATSVDSDSLTCGVTKVIERTWSLTDNCGNTTTKVQTITVRDTTPPSFTVPANITVYKVTGCNEDYSVGITGDVTDESDFCAGVNPATHADVIQPNSCSGTFDVLRTWTVTDACGNSTSLVQTITVADTTRPYFTLPPDRLVSAQVGCAIDTAITTTGTITAAGDECDLSPILSFSQSIVPGSCGNNFDIIRTWTLTDDCGNSRIGSQLIEVRDDTPPSMTIPMDQTVYLDGGSTCNVIESTSFESGYEGWIDGGTNSFRIEQYANSGTFSIRLNNGTTQSRVTSPSLNLNGSAQGTLDFSYIMQGMNTGESLLVRISNNDGASYQLLREFAIGLDVTNNVRYNPSVNIPTAYLVNNVRFQFQLVAGFTNDEVYLDDIAINTCSFNSSCSADISTAAMGVPSGLSDNCTNTLTPTYTETSTPGCGNNFTLFRTWTLTDECGNTNTQTQTITVLDTIDPEMIIPEDVTVYLDASCSVIDTSGTAAGMGIATIIGDNCDANPILSYSDSYSNTCGDQFTIEREWTLTDICGNTETGTQTIMVLDTVSPVLNGIPADTHYQCTTPPAAPALYTGITATDGCDPNVVITFNEVSTRTYNNSCSDVIYTITRTWTATDVCGNTSSQVQNITAECECCGNNIDDDGDGAIDESDSDCPCTTSLVSLNCDPSYYYFVPSIWRMTGGNFDDPSRLIITTPTGTANYTIRTADGSYNDTRTVTQGTADEIMLTTADILTTNNNIVEDDKGFIIESDQALQVLYQLDAFYNKLLITYKGEQALGQRFRTASQTNICGNNPAASDENHFISVMAAEDDTEVTFEFDFPLAGITSPHTVTLDEGETYLVRDVADANQTITGALVTADRPVAVVSGSQHTMNCNNSGGNASGRDGGADQLVPTCLVGQDYVAVRGSGADYSNYVIIVGVTASTAIYLNGNPTPVATVGPGEYFEYQLPGNLGDVYYIRTDRPAYAYQVGNLSTNNEPGMAIMSPVGDCRGESAIEFVAFTGSQNGVNVLVPTTALTSLELNGSDYSTLSGITTAAVPGLASYTSVTIPNSLITAYNRLEADEPFIASQYVGVSGQSGTYGYLTSFKDEVIITNPSTGVSDFSYSLDTLCGGIVFNHCVDAMSCAGGQYITDVVPGPHTTSVSFDPTGFNTCFSYTGEAGYDGFDEITVYVADAYGLITAICVDIYLCGTSPFIQTIPADTLILCDQVIPSEPLAIPISAGCSQSFDLEYLADSTITYNSSCSDYDFTITRSWRLTDNCGNDTTVYQIIMIRDTVDPFLVAPADTFIYSDGMCGLDTLTSQLGEAEDLADNCDPQINAIHIDSFEVNPTCTGSFLIYRKWLIIDDCGNEYSDTQLIEIRDTIAPTFTPPNDTTVYVDNINCAMDTTSASLGEPIGTDNCSLGLISSYSDASMPGCDGSLSIIRTWRVADDCGNFTEGTQLIEVLDSTGPDLIIPSDTTLYLGISCDVDTTAATIGLANTTVDNCDATIIPTFRDSIVTGCDRNYIAYRIWEATDDCGNLSVEIQTIIVADTSIPTMMIPRDTIIYKTEFCAIDTTTNTLGDVVDEDDNCTLVASLEATYRDSVTTDCADGYTISRIWSLVDGCGNVASEIQTIVVSDSSRPSFTMPSDTILYSNSSCFADTSVSMINIPLDLDDNCDNDPTLSYRDSVTTYCIGQYDVQRIWSLMDNCGNVVVDTQLISVLDTLKPELIAPANHTLYADNNCYADTSASNTGLATFENDNCDLSLTVSYFDSIGAGCGVGYEIFRTWSVVDDCGNRFDSTQVITILDQIDPSFTVPNDTILFTDVLCAADTTTSSTGDVVDEMDNCDSLVVAVYSDFIIDDCLGGYIIERTWSVTDDCGNSTSAIQTIEVQDITPPTFTAPRDTTLYSQIGCAIDTLVTDIGDVMDENDFCDKALIPTYRNQITSPCEGSLDILRIWTVSDDCGNVTIDTQYISVMDTLTPSFTIPRDTVLYSNIGCVANTGVSGTGDVTDEDDNCDTSLEATFSQVIADSCFGTFTITRSWTLTDDCGNNFSGDQIIIVRDTFAPTFTQPSDTTIYFDSNCLPEVDPLTVGDVDDELDGCDANVDVTFIDSITSTCGTGYIISRAWTAVDDCGNSRTKIQTITIEDSIPPLYVEVPDTTIHLDSNCRADTTATSIGIPTANDNCGGIVQITYNNTIIPNCEGTYEILRAWIFTDACNNTVVDTQRIQVVDTFPPLFTPPADTILHKDIDCLADTSALNIGVPTNVLDNCDLDVTNITYTNDVTIICDGEYTIVRTWTLTDDCGNTVVHEQNIEVRDTSRPTFTVPNDTLVYLANNCTINVDPILLGDIIDEEDNCDNTLDATFVDVNNNLCGASYDIERTWTLEDACGNSYSRIQTIQVRDSTPPILTLPANTTIYKGVNCLADTTTIELGNVTVTDNCTGIINIEYADSTIIACEGSYELIRIWTASDPCGNTSRDTQFVSVLDTIRPTFTTPIDIEIFADSLCQVNFDPINTGDVTDEYDACINPIEATYTDTTIINCTGDYYIDRTWELTDDCGNIRTDIQRIHVRDTIRPNFSIPSDTTLYVDAACESDTTLAIIGDVLDEWDNCSSDLEATYQDIIVGGCSGSYTMERTWTLVDDCGNTRTRIQTINLIDTIPPSLTAPTDTVAYLKLDCSVDTMPSFTGVLVDFDDNCDSGPAINYRDSTIATCGNGFDIVRIWSVEDECGNIQIDSQRIQVLDTILPSFTTPIDVVLYADVSCNVNSDTSNTGSITNLSDNCSTTLVVDFQDNEMVICLGSYAIERTWTLEDQCGNIYSDVQLITVLDTVRPTLVTPSDITIHASSTCAADTSIATLGDASSIMDNCSPIGELIISHSDSIILGCAGSYDIERSWVLSDACGNTTISIQMITVLDTVAPTFTVPMNITLHVNDSCMVDTTTMGAGDVIDESDGCNTGLEATYSDEISSTCQNSFTITRTWTLVDDCTNITTGVQTITVSDTSRPTFTVPSDTIIFKDGNCLFDDDPMNTGDVTDEEDNCAPTLDATYSDTATTTCEGETIVTRTWRLVDDCSNEITGIQTITVKDTTRPSFTTPIDVVLYADVSCYVNSDTSNTGSITNLSDNCSTTLVVGFQDNEMVNCLGSYAIERTWTLEDQCGNIYSDVQLITVLDTVRPTFVTPSDITIHASSTCAADTSIATLGDASSIMDNCSPIGELIISHSDSIILGCAGSYDIERSWVLSDACGNTTISIQMITVLDTVAPTFTVPMDITLHVNDSCMVDTTTIGAGDVIDESDGCNIGLEATYSDEISSTCQNSFTITRTWTLVDDCTNITTGVQTITVSDTSRPTFTVPSDTIIFKDGNCLFDTDPLYVGDVTDEEDNCALTLDATYSDTMTSTCEGETIVTRTWRLVDDCSNEITGIQTITVKDTTRPSFTTPIDVVLYADVSCYVNSDTSNTGSITNLSDNCSTTLVVDFQDNEMVNCLGSYAIERTWTLEDQCGNIYSDVQLITVLDTMRPSFVSPPNVTIYSTSTCAADTSVTTLGEASAIVDNCSPVSDLIITHTDTIMSGCVGSYDIERSWILSDACGNTRISTQIITVLDTLAPVFTTPSEFTVYLDDSCLVNILPVITGDIVDAIDGCDTNVTIDYNDVISNDCGGSYTITRTWRVSDLCGNTSSDTQTIMVADTAAPSYSTPEDTILYLDSLCFADTTIVSTGNVMDLSDNCGSIVSVNYTDEVTELCGGSYIVERTWTVSDGCNNEESSIQIIEVQDTIQPSFSLPNDITVFLDSVNFVDSSAVATGEIIDGVDNCSGNISITYRDSIVEINNAGIKDEVYRIWSVSDDCNYSSVRIQIINLLDTIPPSYSTPPVVEIDCEDIPDIDTVSFADINGIADISMIETRIDTPCIDRYTIVRTWTATDSVGNQSSVDQIYEVSTCTAIVDAQSSGSNVCTGDFITLSSTFSHVIGYTYYPRWYYRPNVSLPWQPVPGGTQEDFSFPGYSFRAGDYKVIYAPDMDHLSDVQCHYESEILNVNVIPEEPVTYTTHNICEGEVFSIGDSLLTEEGDYNIIFSNRFGCDSIVSLRLGVFPSAPQYVDATICAGEYYESTSGARYTETGTYRDSLSNVFLCDSIIVVNLEVLPSYDTLIFDVICENEPYFHNGEQLDSSGIYIDSLQSISGCDSIVRLNLTINPFEVSYEEIYATICSGSTYQFDNLAFNMTTTATRGFPGMNGCDTAIVTLHLSVVDEIVNVLYDTICYNSSRPFGNLSLIQSGIYRDTLTSSMTCDSIDELHLYVRPQIEHIINVEICSNDTYVFKNNSYNTTQTLRDDDLISSSGCDSSVIINLLVPDPQVETVDITLCSGDSVLVDNQYIYNTTSLTRQYANFQGCMDSIVNYNVVVSNVVRTDFEHVICEGDSMLIQGVYRSTPGPYQVVRQTAITGCDSIITNNLIVEDVIDMWGEDVNVCLGESFNIVVDGAENILWTDAHLLSCNNCPNPSGRIDETRTFTGTTPGCAGSTLSINVTVNVFDEVSIEALTPDTLLTYGESIVLNAFISDPFVPMTWYDQNGEVLCTNCTQIQVTPDMSMSYYVEANSNSGCTVRDIVNVSIKDGCDEGKIIVPNFISPNGDGLNEDIRIRYEAIQSINKMRVFNRWGQLVFKTDDVENERWNGMINGQLANPGVYVYFIEYQCLNGDAVFQKGNITVLR